jgi:hypothetical protein
MQETTRENTIVLRRGKKRIRGNITMERERERAKRRKC